MSALYRDHWVVVTGARSVEPHSAARVEATMDHVVGSGALGIVFGGAFGVDTIALKAAWRSRSTGGRPKLVVVVPGYVAQQPSTAQSVIRECADEIIEMGLPLDQPRSFQTRNERMLTEGRLRDPDEEPVVVAFPLDGVMKGGTRNCMAAARRHGLVVAEFPLPARGGID